MKLFQLYKQYNGLFCLARHLHVILVISVILVRFCTFCYNFGTFWGCKVAPLLPVWLFGTLQVAVWYFFYGCIIQMIICILCEQEENCRVISVSTPKSCWLALSIMNNFKILWRQDCKYLVEFFERFHSSLVLKTCKIITKLSSKFLQNYFEALWNQILLTEFLQLHRYTEVHGLQVYGVTNRNSN